MPLLIALRDIILPPSASIREALRRIDAAGTQLALVADEDDRLLGTVSDGDIRRGLLAELSLDDCVDTCMHVTPLVARSGTTDAQLLELLRHHGLHQIPIVDQSGRIVDLKLMDDLLAPRARDNPVVLMVGGLGQRLGDLTRDRPKPMLDVGGRPILEHIVRNFIAQGFHRFWFAVNYRAEIIEHHFGDGSAMGCEIRYLRERQRMGTAGALSLLPDRPDLPLVVSNGDLLTKADMGALVDHHDESAVDATMAVREYEVQVPYGVVQTDGGLMVGIEEKPIHRHLIAGGLYVLSPHTLDHVPTDTFFDMPALLEKIAGGGGQVSVFAIDGYWLDIGRHADYQRACNDFGLVMTKTDS
jgi:dTDP-glucose pyrophosphorylase